MSSTGFNARQASPDPEMPAAAVEAVEGQLATETAGQAIWWPLLRAGLALPRLSHISALYLVTAVCGLIDAACYLSLGGVFAEIMTGNLLFLTFGLGSGLPFGKLYRYLLVLAAFAVGAVAGGRVLRGELQHSRLGYFVEWALLVIALVATLVFHPGPSGAARDFVVSCLAFAMGVQNALMRRHGVPDLATNVMTLTMTGLIAESRIAGGGSDRWPRRLSSVSIFVVTATLGAVLTHLFGPAVPLALAVLIFTVALAGIDPRHASRG